MRAFRLTLAFCIFTLLLAACGSPTAAAPTPQPAGTSVAETLAAIHTASAPTVTPTAEPTATATALPAAYLTSSNAASITQVMQWSSTYPSRVSWSTDSKRFAVVGSDSTTLFDINQVGPVMMGFPETGQSIVAASASADAFAVTSDFHTVVIKSITQEIVLQTLVVTGMMGFSFSPDGKSLAISTDDQWKVMLFDIASGQVTGTLTGFETAAPVYSGSFGEDGKSLVWVSRATAQVSDIATNTIGPRMDHEDFITSYALSPDGKLFAAGNSATIDGNYVPIVRLWDPKTATVIGDIKIGSEMAYALSFSPDGKLLAAAVGSQITIWDVASRTQVAALNGHTAAVNSVAFSPDGTLIISAGSDDTVRMWGLQ